MVRKIDQQSIRKQNIERIWALFVDQVTLTRQQLAEGTGLSVMTVTNLVDHLKRCRVLDFATPARQNGPGQKSTGRKAEAISLSTERHAWIILDLTKPHFHFQALALDMSTIVQGTPWPYALKRELSLNLRDFLRQTRSTIDKELSGREILGVAVVVPGSYDVDSDTVTNQRMPGMNSIKMKEMLRQELGLYDYYVDEDVKFAVRAFLPLSAQTYSEVLYYIFIGEGVGGATIHNGNVLRGLNAAAGDAGQLMSRDGAIFEQKLSLRSFAQALGLAVREADNEDDVLGGITRVMTEDFSRYQEALMQCADMVGDIAYSVIWLLDPSHIVVDCRYASPYQDLFTNRIRQRIATLLSSSLPRLPVVLSAPLEMRSVTYGAVQVLSREWIARISG